VKHNAESGLVAIEYLFSRLKGFVQDGGSGHNTLEEGTRRAVQTGDPCHHGPGSGNFGIRLTRYPLRSVHL
jgi:hypothetical protein